MKFSLSTVFCTRGIKDVAVKHRNSTKKEIIRRVESHVPGVRFFVVDQQQDVFNMMRSVSARALFVERGWGLLVFNLKALAIKFGNSRWCFMVMWNFSDITLQTNPGAVGSFLAGYGSKAFVGQLRFSAGFSAPS